jgi:signal transduction histidine kinase
MSTLVDDLLLLARADDDTLTAKAEELDLSDRVCEVTDRLVPMAHQRHLQLVLGSLPAVPVCGDPAALDRAIGNVIENAIKYTSGVGHRVTIETGRRLDEGELWGWLEVTDDGPGITPDHLPHVFERFYRADSARTPSSATGEEMATEVETPVKGTGLGLSIAQSVATSHGGEIQIHSNPGEGCRVILSLPLAQYRLIS